MTGRSDSQAVAAAAGVNLLGMLAKSSRALVTLFVTRVSGPATFGLFMLVLAVVELVTRFTIFGMDKALLKFLPEVRERGDGEQYAVLSTVLATGLVFSMLTAVAIAWAAPWIAQLWLKEPALAFPLRVMALAVIPLTMATLVLAATKALKIMRYDAVVTGLVMPLGMLALSVPILWTEDHVLTLALAYVVSTAAGCAGALWFFERHFSLGRSFRAAATPMARRVLSFSTPLGIHDFVQYLAMKLEIFLLAYFVSPVDLGVYFLASELSFVLKKARQTVDPILIPLMSEARSLGQRDRLQEQLQRVIRWLLLVGVPYVGALALFSEPVLGVFGNEFVVGGTVLVLLCGAQLLNVTTSVLDMAMLASDRPRINLLNVSLLLISQTVLNLLLIPRAGIVGAAVAALGAFTLLAVVRVVQAALVLRLSPFARTQFTPVMAGIGAAVPVLLTLTILEPNGVVWLPLMAVFVFGYWALLKVIGLHPEDVAIFRSIAKR